MYYLNTIKLHILQKKNREKFEIVIVKTNFILKQKSALERALNRVHESVRHAFNLID